MKRFGEILREANGEEAYKKLDERRHETGEHAIATQELRPVAREQLGRDLIRLTPELSQLASNHTEQVLAEERLTRQSITVQDMSETAPVHVTVN